MYKYSRPIDAKSQQVLSEVPGERRCLLHDARKGSGRGAAGGSDRPRERCAAYRSALTPRQPLVDFLPRCVHALSLVRGISASDNWVESIEGEPMSKLSLSDTLVSLRTAHRLTQEEVASHLGITKAAISKWECGVSQS